MTPRDLVDQLHDTARRDDAALWARRLEETDDD